VENHCITVPGAQVTNSERDYILKLSGDVTKNVESPVMVNIGIMWGCTLWCLRDGSPDAHLYGVDIVPDKWPITDVDDLKVHILKGDSRTLPFYNDIHLLLIDGDHHYETVSADIANWIPRVVPGGVAIFHDYAPSRMNMMQFPELEGVRRAVDEWFEQSTGWEKLAVVDSIVAFRKEGASA
jgi:hypothetical protein